MLKRSATSRAVVTSPRHRPTRAGLPVGVRRVGPSGGRSRLPYPARSAGRTDVSVTSAGHLGEDVRGHFRTSEAIPPQMTTFQNWGGCERRTPRCRDDQRRYRCRPARRAHPCRRPDRPTVGQRDRSCVRHQVRTAAGTRLPGVLSVRPAVVLSEPPLHPNPSSKSCFRLA
jgi:hypothetical protein